MSNHEIAIEIANELGRLRRAVEKMQSPVVGDDFLAGQENAYEKIIKIISDRVREIHESNQSS